MAMSPMITVSSLQQTYYVTSSHAIRIFKNNDSQVVFPEHPFSIEMHHTCIATKTKKKRKPRSEALAIILYITYLINSWHAHIPRSESSVQS